jgi:hypothetical protein
LENLAGMQHLECLTLRAAKVADAGLEHLQRLKQLTDLRLYDTQVTDARVKKFQQALPNCWIEWQPPTSHGRRASRRRALGAVEIWQTDW